MNFDNIPEDLAKEIMEATSKWPYSDIQEGILDFVAKALNRSQKTIEELVDQKRNLAEERNQMQDKLLKSEWNEHETMLKARDIEQQFEVFKRAADETMKNVLEQHSLDLEQARLKGFNEATDKLVEKLSYEEENAKAIIESDKLRIEKLHVAIEGSHLRLAQIDRIKAHFGRAEE